MICKLIKSAIGEAVRAAQITALLLVVVASALALTNQASPRVSAEVAPLSTRSEELSLPSTSETKLQPPAGALNIPILMYHKTPADFEAQMMALKGRGYETVSMDTVALALKGGPLPAKPVVITFDDGFADQMQAYDILKRHGMRATYYIINAGERSQWCIGAGRRYGDPLQPAGGCGDAYMSWDQVRELDRSGIIEIAAHTIDHADLPMLTADEQRAELADSKAGLERELGHAVRHVAYPYGAFDATTIQLAHEVGFETAVTTIAGTWQTPGHEYELVRVRDPYALP
jgi:peptidoglycan/xylan/chitin deacetylase (PgdA/CDA1 family)